MPTSGHRIEVHTARADPATQVVLALPLLQSLAPIRTATDRPNAPPALGVSYATTGTPSAGTAKSTALGIVVSDLATTMQELRARGVVFNDYDIEDGPQTIDGIASDGSGMAAWFTDSEGNIVNLVQLPPGFPEL